MFTAKGLKFLGAFFGAGFFLGLITGVVGFTVAVDIMAGR